ncbi:hypothetical protein EC988_001945 [Linderina pennispora]|nr:hypothetical protein EC988_001945 [Linderina pennispora]
MGSHRHDAAPISQDDYFKLNAPFRLWLRKERNTYFDELPTDKARRHFASFVHRWNAGKLRSRYYQADPSLAGLPVGTATRHSWGHTQDSTQGSTQGPTLPSKDQAKNSSKRFHHEQREREHERRKRSRREDRDRTELILDEVAPKETGREAKILKRRAKSQKLHQDKSMDATLDDSELYGDAGSEFRKLVRSRDQRRAAKQGSLEKQAAASDLREKERQTIERYRQMALESKELGRGMFAED